MALVIPTAATAMLTAITEPFEFTFLFIAPALFAVHAVLTSVFAMVIYTLGVSGAAAANIGGIAGFIIPLINNHMDSLLVYFITGIIFVGLYFFIFRWAILKFNLATPGREKDEEVQMYTKQDYQDKKASEKSSSNREEDLSGTAKKAYGFLTGLGGADINNCTTRLRISVNDPEKLKDDSYFKKYGAHGVVRNGEAIQVIVGMDVPQVRDEFETRVNENKTLD